MLYPIEPWAQRSCILYLFIQIARKNDNYFIFVVNNIFIFHPKNGIIAMMKPILGAFFACAVLPQVAFGVDFPTVAQPVSDTMAINDLDFVEFPRPKSETDLEFVAFPEPAGGILKATQFPKTAQDLSFGSRNELKEEGYAPFADLSSYDILTIVYTDKNIAEEIATDEEEAEDEEDTGEETSHYETPGGGVSYCMQRAPHIPTNQKIPIGKPVLESDYVYCSKYGVRNFGDAENPKYDDHHGFDIGCTLASFNRPVFTPADGVVKLVKKNRRGSSAGNYIMIEHQNGFKTYYMHLNTILVRQGQTVAAGCQIATIGYTGGAKAFKAALNTDYPMMNKSISHLHYEMHYNGSLTYVTTPDDKRIPIVHGFSGHQSIDPAPFMGVSIKK